ncbi:hypothetical protein EGR_02676 [Echinococcus granulosus]|uniref:Uncharacterized protein n=1 Tax=Echinococcus granulosus TaxID=6210 RepID=W6V7U6_ECHGR|nr:hypothetical protein EGR_02676 [Echinococcus granulosus]EUB62544.1 hypothetical protein EGR_02676 [Echinococcus granulosus]
MRRHDDDDDDDDDDDVNDGGNEFLLFLTSTDLESRLKSTSFLSIQCLCRHYSEFSFINVGEKFLGIGIKSQIGYF